MDIMTPGERSDRMRLIRAANTKPELAVRRIVYGMGYRYRLHGDDLPGRPDIVFRKMRKVIFVHGCFWHLHRCPSSRPPRSKLDYWVPKLQGNAERDKTVRQRLRRMGWKTLIVWECQLKRIDRLSHRIRVFLEEKAKIVD
ncbi:MAG: very short patch repair endonuclease [Candidatus Sulfotelmatobacter sp.]